jgi:hypothetical protein
MMVQISVLNVAVSTVTRQINGSRKGAPETTVEGGSEA